MNALKRTEIGVCGLIIVFCLAIIWETRSLPPGHFEPLGSGPFPMAIAGLVFVLCIAAIVIAVFRDDTGREAPDRATRSAFFFVAMVLIYAAVFSFRAVDFGILTTFFLFFTIGGLERFQRKLLPWIVVVSLVVGMGTSLVFTRFLYVDLPTWF